ncbi:MAG: hypothetical protein IR160_11385 [Salinibacterium sp.]|nr:hypothetical protein [Salinibacterium sp.]MBF0673174.1 hypothetical protein [Salinibacterium sp.]
MSVELDGLVARAHRLVTTPKRDSLRTAMRQRRRTAAGYGKALDEMQPRHYGAVKAYAAALSAEAAAQRADAQELREMLAAILSEQIGGVS